MLNTGGRLRRSKRRPIKEGIKEAIRQGMKDAGAVVSHIANTTKCKASDAKDSMVDVMDANGNREFDIEYIVIYGPKIPGIHMDRGNFLRKEFMKRYPQDVINDAVRYNPAHAQIPGEDIDEIADEVIKYERSLVSGISIALGMLGGIATVVTIPIGFGPILWLYAACGAEADVSIWLSGDRYNGEEPNI